MTALSRGFLAGLSPSNLALPDKLSKLKTDTCYFDDYFKCLKTGPPSCAATIATECSTIFKHNVEASEKASRSVTQRVTQSIKSDWTDPVIILGIVAGVLLFFTAGIKYYVRRKKLQASYDAGKGVGNVAVAVLMPQD